MVNSDLNSKNTVKSRYKSVGKENGVASSTTSSSFESLGKDEDRTSYLTRQGFEAILEYENRLKLTPQEDSAITAELERLEEEINHHIDNVVTYVTEPEDTRTSTSFKQAQDSLNWLETVVPEVGQPLKRELFLRHKDHYNKDRLQAEKTDSKGEESVEHQESLEAQNIDVKSRAGLVQQAYLIEREPPIPAQLTNNSANRGLDFSHCLCFFGGMFIFLAVGKIINHYQDKNKNV